MFKFSEAMSFVVPARRPSAGWRDRDAGKPEHVMKAVLQADKPAIERLKRASGGR